MKFAHLACAISAAVALAATSTQTFAMSYGPFKTAAQCNERFGIAAAKTQRNDCNACVGQKKTFSANDDKGRYTKSCK